MSVMYEAGPKCECQLHHEDEPCPRPAVWEVGFPERPTNETRKSCNKCLGAVCGELLSGRDGALRVMELMA